MKIIHALSFFLLFVVASGLLKNFQNAYTEMYETRKEERKKEKRSIDEFKNTDYERVKEKNV